MSTAAASWDAGQVCPTCGTWHNGYHSCAGIAAPTTLPATYTYYSTAPVDERVVALLERIAVALERLAK
jgi:hypothetical protein